MDLRGMSVVDMSDLSGKCVVITGGGQGFGAAIARRMGSVGAHVVVAARTADKIEAVADSIPDGRGTAHPTDVNDPDAVQQLIDTASDITGRVDVLVNNAGAFSNYLLTDMTMQEFQRVINTNVMGSFLCAQAAARAMKADDKGGVIVNMASVDSFQPSSPGLIHYVTSKHALIGLTRALAMELAPWRIRVNAVCPGASMTEGVVDFIKAGAPQGIDIEAEFAGIADITPLRRLCSPEDVAVATLFLASDLSSFITGTALPVDGGILTQPYEGYPEGYDG
jgi:3-oxoacyl-[acyl-carrier protein] reductase